MTRAKNKIIIGIALVGLFFICKETLAVETSLYLDADTVEKGYTVSLINSQFNVGIVPGVHNQGFTVNLYQLNQYPSFPKDTTAVSDVYKFSLADVQTSELQSPINVTVAYESDNQTPKYLYYYNESEESWTEIDATSTDSTLKGQINSTTAKVVALEKSAYRVSLDQVTLEKGFTVQNSENPNFKVGIFPNTINQPSTVVFKTVEQGDVAFPEGLERVSDIYSFELKTAESVVFENPVVLSLELTKTSDYKKEVYYYDSNRGTWISLPSRTAPGGDEIRAFIHLKYAKVVVLQDSNYMETGYASWYRSSRYPNGAASNDYPYDARLRVTNLANGNWVDVTVVSTGPFVEGRIIDLTHTAFSAIANTYVDGVVRVQVEELR